MTSIRSLCRSLRSGLTLKSSPGAIAPPPIPLSIPNEDHVKTQIKILPPAHNKVYCFPTPDKYAMELPTLKSLILDKSDPQNLNLRIEEPTSNKAPLIAGPRMLTIRRKKMKKHKRIKRYHRDYFKYQTHHRKKKAKAEALFRQRMHEIMDELHSFDPLEHVKDTIARAQREWNTSLAESGRKKYPHWSQLMSLEELYGLPKITHIEKHFGYPTPEDEPKIGQLRKEYFKKYTRLQVKKSD
ncbi:unnamed protein product [Bursaphelenchus xylophilus]|uniref:(pine wood nematode) hypothetical protein n=1 Tax=Bursaphelenchus xylophilus TaxID=6326 RepID=A0A1I7SSM8_BURXY|nr:unnamed protein product [Bursaphelenchus xylophilus]CAG9097390.1 unnamed protein product [Bursaphelenchus xylophilus]